MRATPCSPRGPASSAAWCRSPPSTASASKRPRSRPPSWPRTGRRSGPPTGPIPPPSGSSGSASTSACSIASGTAATARSWRGRSTRPSPIRPPTGCSRTAGRRWRRWRRGGGSSGSSPTSSPGWRTCCGWRACGSCSRCWRSQGCSAWPNRSRRSSRPRWTRPGSSRSTRRPSWVDRTFWRVIANDENALPQGEWVAELAPELLSWLGSTDAELRDEFAYRILAAWVEREQFQPDQLRDMVRQMLDNLYIGLGERDTDTVFLRSYSTLVLMEVVAYDNAHPFLGQGEAAGLLDQVLEYLRKERDLRSWVEGPGWAHAVAHTADLLMMLDGIADRLLEPSGVVFVQHEDERLAYAALNVLRRGLVGRAARDRWLERFVRPSGHD